MKWILLIGMLCAFLLVVSCTQAPQLTEEPEPEVIAPEDSVATVPGTIYNVVIENDKFMPTSLEVKVGDTVTWINKDDTDHAVFFDNGAVDEKLPVGSSVSHTFTEKGEFSYLCQIHPEMQGKVIVG